MTASGKLKRKELFLPRMFLGQVTEYRAQEKDSQDTGNALHLDPGGGHTGVQPMQISIKCGPHGEGAFYWMYLFLSHREMSGLEEFAERAE